MRPHPWQPKKIRTIWVDYTTGVGCEDNGQRVRPKIGDRRKNPNLADLLDTAAGLAASRIMLTGKIPPTVPGKSHWLLVNTPGWASNGHWLASPATGRFIREATGEKVEIHTAAAWFGEIRLSPQQARIAWETTQQVLTHVEPNMGSLMNTPAGTGTNLWAHSLPANLDPEPVTDDIAEEIHHTSGQHHIEHLVAGPSASDHPDCLPLVNPSTTPRIGTFAYTDGRFMYAALCRELGTGPARRIRRDEAYDLMTNDPYARARYLVKFTVPDTWNHLGLLGVQHPDGQSWYYPNRPGATAETWADAAEVAVALRAGWRIEPIEGVVFSKHKPSSRGEKRSVAARPLDTFAARVIKAREAIEADQDMDPLLKRAVGTALRAIVIQTIGAFASRGRDQTITVTASFEVPPEYVNSAKQYGNMIAYTVRNQLTDRTRPFYRPELAAQIWGRGRARILSAPAANGHSAGALTVPPHTLLGINGDAIYTTEVPPWALPADHGGGDDGKTGKLRLQGILTGDIPTPKTREARDRLMNQASKQGPQAAYETTEPGEA
ncbi:hypothetical protein [Arthrobacter pigmenti]